MEHSCYDNILVRVLVGKPWFSTKHRDKSELEDDGFGTDGYSDRIKLH